MSEMIDKIESTSARKVVVASRGTVNSLACQLIRSLPLRSMELVALSVSQSHRKEKQGKSHQCAGLSSGSGVEPGTFEASASLFDPGNACTLDGEQVETVYRVGDLVPVLTDMAASDAVAMTALFGEENTPQCRQQVARDSAAVLRRTRKPLLVAAGEYTASTNGNLLMVIGGGLRQIKLADCHIDRLADLASAEVVVLSVLKPFRPVFSRVAVGMRGYQGEAIREVHGSQVQDATAEAMRLCETLRAKGAKSWAVGKVGKLVPETRNAAESCDCTLICIPVDDVDVAHERRIHSLLMELLGCAKAPILMLPPEVRAH